MSDPEAEDISPLEDMVKERENKLVRRLQDANTRVELIEAELAHKKALIKAKKDALQHADDDPIPPLAKKISTTDANIKRLEAVLDKKRAQAKAIAEDIDLFESGNKKSIFYLERVRGGRMSLLWLITICLTLFCTFGTFSTRAYGLSAANFAAFLVVWRKLYVNSSNFPILVAVVIVGLTIKFF